MTRPLTIIFLLAILGGVRSPALAADEAPAFKITTTQASDTVEIQTEKQKTTFVVKSPKGISEAVIERVADKWPAVVTLHLHLKGLESFVASNGRIRLEVAVSSHNDKPHVRQWKDGKEDSPLDAKSPYWMEVRLMGRDGQPTKTIPLDEGYFEMTLPKAFLDGDPKAVTLKWIDFYRN